MRYQNIQTYTFKNNKVYDMRKIPVYQITGNIPRNPGEDMDEIYSRNEIAGSGTEAQSYVLHEVNIKKILDSNFDYDQLKSVAIPEAGQSI